MYFLTFVPLTGQIKRTTVKKIIPVERENISLGSVFLWFVISHLIREKKEANVLAIWAFFYAVKIFLFLEKWILFFSEIKINKKSKKYTT